MKRALLVILIIAVSASSKFLWADPSHFSKSPILGLTPEQEIDLKAKINELQGKITECKEKIEEVSIYTEEAQSHLEDVKSEVDSIIMIPIDDEIGFEIGNLSTEKILDLIVDQSTSSDLEETVTIKQQTLKSCIGYLTSVNNRYSEIKATIKQLVIDGATRYQNRIVEASVSIEKCRSKNAIDAKKNLRIRHSGSQIRSTNFSNCTSSDRDSEKEI